MYGQLGTIVFEGVLSPDAITIDGAETYAKHALINQRQRVDHTGTELRTIAMSIQFHVAFCTPEASIDQMWGAKNTATILSFVLGNGRVIGDFVIASISENWLNAAPDGTLIAARLTINLLEIYSDATAKATQVQQAARAAGIALGENDVTPVRARDTTYLTNSWKVIEAISLAAQIAAAISNVIKYASVPDFWINASSQLGLYVGAASAACNTSASVLGADSSLTDLCPLLFDAVTSNLEVLTDMRDALPITTYDVFSGLDATLQAATQAMQDAAYAIYLNVIMRR